MRLPEAFIRRLKNDIGEEASSLIKALDDESPVSIRINPIKGYNLSGLEKVPWCETGFYLAERPVFTLDPLFHAGAYYVQEASSMFLEQIVKETVDLTQPLKVLDLCGAPGGKATHLASLISGDSLLVANEVIRPRAKILAENLAKWGNPNVVVTSNDPADFQRLSGFFDLLVVDAPCSGEGMFRKDPRSVTEWSESGVLHCAARQRRIVADAWDCLKEGGILIYSTCTYNRAENDENIRWILQEMKGEPVYPDIAHLPELTSAGNLPGYRLYPHKIRGEGFFISAIRKNGGDHFHPIKIRKPKLGKAGNTVQKAILPWLTGTREFDLFSFHEKVLAFPSSLQKDIFSLTEKLAIIQAGTEICEVKGTNLIPSQPLAFSIILNKDHFPDETLDLSSAIKYLRKEEIHPARSGQYLLATFQNTPLGFLKKAGNRYNNLYPKEWRIRMELIL